MPEASQRGIGDGLCPVSLRAPAGWRSSLRAVTSAMLSHSLGIEEHRPRNDGGGAAALAHRHMHALAESLMAEMISGAAPLASQTGVPIPNEPNWTADVTIESESQADLYLVTVRVQHLSNSSMGDVKYELSRLVRDPGGVLLARSAEAERLAAEEEEAAAAAAQDKGGEGLFHASRKYGRRPGQPAPWPSNDV